VLFDKSFRIKPWTLPGDAFADAHVRCDIECKDQRRAIIVAEERHSKFQLVRERRDTLLETLRVFFGETVGLALLQVRWAEIPLIIFIAKA